MGYHLHHLNPTAQEDGGLSLHGRRIQRIGASELTKPLRRGRQHRVCTDPRPGFKKLLEPWKTTCGEIAFQQYMVDEPPRGQPMKGFSKEPKKEMDGSGKYGDANIANIFIINLNPDEKHLGRSIGWCHYSIRLRLCRLLWGNHRSNYIMDNGLLIRGRYSNSWF